MKKVNLIVPCYNEAEALPLFKDELNKVIQTLDQYTFEILLINDGSTDTTLSVMKEICDTDSHYKYISFSRNFGKEAAMYAGFCNSDGDYAAIMDADIGKAMSEYTNSKLMNDVALASAAQGNKMTSSLLKLVR